ncbi:FeoA family protein [Desulfosporosinus sp.]|uniref:FeoA family protein n=1 Tax=Desulfosporosinus sp. TaxID=157907 RepID=UPI000E8C6E0A|nr:FeoA family protein [Desulfosporosinus sp.]MBC2724155.1 ferrous iron transport protein A [Desulfosporosinus sp.]MBC2724977.1 ferrous iron transport protein A [Desulfosporosinus sp.]HBV86401.1 ferrous iron transport protein A [Desulfosporosinus sp.]
MGKLSIPLSTLKLGQTSSVVHLEVKGLLRRRILDMGIVPGTILTCIGRAPAGDPIAYLVRDTVIALRSEDARLINVEQV